MKGNHSEYGIADNIDIASKWEINHDLINEHFH